MCWFVVLLTLHKNALYFFETFYLKPTIVHAKRELIDLLLRPYH